jgi:hypothetical protein
MHRTVLLASGALLLAAWLGTLFPSTRGGVAAGLAGDTATGARIAKAAAAFLASLDEAQRGRSSFAFADEERFNWHFIPRERKGIAVRDLSEAQKKLLDALLEASLSETGVKTAREVRKLESILKEIEGPNGRFRRDPDLYFISVFGTPGEAGAWGWRFEGHHLSLNFTLDGHRLVSATPLVFGANPALVASGPTKGLRVLASVEDVARELVKSLEHKHLEFARGKEEPKEIEGMQSPVYQGDRPRGLTLDALPEAGRKIVERLVDAYIQHLDESTRAAARKAIFGSDPAKVHFVWRGGLEPGEGHSYMLHAPDFVISYVNTQNDARHVHSALRLLKGEFGRKSE